MLSELRDTIVQWDLKVWYYLNTQWHNPFMDKVVPFLRHPYFWSPLYLFLLIYMPSRFRAKGWLWCLGFLVSFIIADQVSATFMKPYFHRLRPCHNPSLSHVIHQVVNCGGQYGFPSSHAANHFAIGIFMAVTLSRKVKWIWSAAILWALSVSFAQVYVGVHFPLDVTVGGLLGTSIGLITGGIFNRYFDLAKEKGPAEKMA